MLSVIIPAFKEEANIATAGARIGSILHENGIPFELIFVDDGSPDGTWAAIKRWAAEPCGPDGIRRGLRFSRNFGKEAAIFSGLSAAKGDCCAVLDCDMQHPPEALVEMYRAWENGAEVVEGVKLSRGREGLLYKGMSKLFYGLISRAVGRDMRSASDFKLLDRKVVDEILRFPERNLFFRAITGWVGFSTATVSFSVQERADGSGSRWSLSKLTRYALTNITSFSTLPMQIVTVIAALFLVLAVIIGVKALVMFFSGTAVEGFTTVILLQLISGGAILFGIGVIGWYIARIYEEVKQRPRYIVAERIGE